MEKIKESLKKLSIRRIIAVLLGNIVLGFGISVFKFAGMGNDPYTAMIFSVSDYFGFYFPIYQICFNATVFVLFEITLGRKYIGLGTVVNMFFLGYIVNFFVNILNSAFPEPESFIPQFFTMLIGVVVTCFGISIYQTADVGVSPYDSLSIIMSDRISKLPYFWARMITDSLCALATFLTGGLLGLGTLVCAFGLGPVTHFFNKTISEPLINGKEKPNK